MLQTSPVARTTRAGSGQAGRLRTDPAGGLAVAASCHAAAIRLVGGGPGGVSAGNGLPEVDQAGLAWDEVGFVKIPVVPLAGLVEVLGALAATLGEFAGDLVGHGSAPRPAAFRMVWADCRFFLLISTA